MEIGEAVPLPPDEEGGEQVRPNFVDGSTGLIFDGQQVDNGDGIWDAQEKQQGENTPGHRVAILPGGCKRQLSAKVSRFYTAL